MLEFQLAGIRFKIQIWFPILCLYMLYTDPNGMVLTAVSAAMLHELGHLGAMIVCGEIPETVIVSAFGVRFETKDDYYLSFAKDAFIAFCGPFVNVFTAIAVMNCDRTVAFVHVWLGSVNLLPLFPLDGERILFGLMRLKMTDGAVDRWHRILSRGIWLLLCVVSVAVLMVSKGNVSLLIFCVYIGLSNRLKQAS